MVLVLEEYMRTTIFFYKTVNGNMETRLEKKKRTKEVNKLKHPYLLPIGASVKRLQRDVQL